MPEILQAVGLFEEYEKFNLDYAAARTFIEAMELLNDYSNLMVRKAYGLGSQSGQEKYFRPVPRFILSGAPDFHALGHLARL